MGLKSPLQRIESARGTFEPLRDGRPGAVLHGLSTQSVGKTSALARAPDAARIGGVAPCVSGMAEADVRQDAVEPPRLHPGVPTEQSQ
jgi:hypothetical protein